MKARMYLTKNSVVFELNGERVEVGKDQFYEALKECEEALKGNSLVAMLSFGESSPELVKIMETKRRTVTRAVRAYASVDRPRPVKVYLDQDLVKWLGIGHGSLVEIAKTKLFGDKVVVIRKAEGHRLITLTPKTAERLIASGEAYALFPRKRGGIYEAYYKRGSRHHPVGLVEVRHVKRIRSASELDEYVRKSGYKDSHRWIGAVHGLASASELHKVRLLVPIAPMGKHIS